MSSKQVLIVDDDAAILEMIAELLSYEGYKVVTYSEGRRAVAFARSILPALILLDLMMPEMDGFEVVEALREREGWRSIPIVVVTAKNLTADDHSRLNGYVERILQKGAYSREDLLAEIRSRVTAYLDRQRT